MTMTIYHWTLIKIYVISPRCNYMNSQQGKCHNSPIMLTKELVTFSPRSWRFFSSEQRMSGEPHEGIGTGKSLAFSSNPLAASALRRLLRRRRPGAQSKAAFLISLPCDNEECELVKSYNHNPFQFEDTNGREALTTAMRW